MNKENVPLQRLMLVRYISDHFLKTFFLYFNVAFLITFGTGLAISHLPGHGEVAGGALALADEAHDVSLRLVLVERRVGDHGSAWNTKNISRLHFQPVLVWPWEFIGL